MLLYTPKWNPGRIQQMSICDSDEMSSSNSYLIQLVSRVSVKMNSTWIQPGPGSNWMSTLYSRYLFSRPACSDIGIPDTPFITLKYRILKKNCDWNQICTMSTMLNNTKQVIQFTSHNKYVVPDLQYECKATDMQLYAQCCTKKPTPSKTAVLEKYWLFLTYWGGVSNGLWVG
jgi:hypothetical protein